MSERIVFVLMSALQRPATVDQLARVLAPHPLVVHHDPSRQAGFALDAPNAHLVPDPRPTERGTWAFMEALFHAARYALDRFEADYVQLVTPTCLPIRPIAEFEAMVEAREHDANADVFALEKDADTLMSFAYRDFAPRQSLRYKLLRRARQIYFAGGPEVVQMHGLAIHRRRVAHGAPLPWHARAALAFTRYAADGGLGAVPFGDAFPAMMGSTWFGARRRVWEYLLARVADPAIVEYFSRLWIAEEVLLPTLLVDGGFRIGPSNHAINAFDEGSPRWITPRDLEPLAATGRYFARKFPDDPYAPVRAAALALAARRPRVRAPAPVLDVACARAPLGREASARRRRSARRAGSST